MHHNSELHKALGDETGKQQAAITPHTEGPGQRHQGEGAQKTLAQPIKQLPRSAE